MVFTDSGPEPQWLVRFQRICGFLALTQTTDFTAHDRLVDSLAMRLNFPAKATRRMPTN
jgi:hypothetical protein